MNRVTFVTCVLRIVTCFGYKISFLKDSEPDKYIKIDHNNMPVIENSPLFIGMEIYTENHTENSTDEDVCLELNFSFESFSTLSKLYSKKPIGIEITSELFIEILKLADFLGYDFDEIDYIFIDMIENCKDRRILTIIPEQNFSVEFQKSVLRKMIYSRIEILKHKTFKEILKDVDNVQSLIENSPLFKRMNNYTINDPTISKYEDVFFESNFSFESLEMLSKLYAKKPIKVKMPSELVIEILKLADFLGYNFNEINYILPDMVNNSDGKKILTRIREENLSADFKNSVLRNMVFSKIENLYLGLSAKYSMIKVLISSFSDLKFVSPSDKTPLKQITLDEKIIKRMNRLDCLEYLDVFFDLIGIEYVVLTGFSVKSYSDNRSANITRYSYRRLELDDFDSHYFILELIKRKNITHLQIEDSSLTKYHCTLISKLSNLKYINLENNVSIADKEYKIANLYVDILDNIDIESLGWIDVYSDYDKWILMNALGNSKSLKNLLISEKHSRDFTQKLLLKEGIDLKQLVLRNMDLCYKHMWNWGNSMKSLNSLKFISCYLEMFDSVKNDFCLPNVKELSLRNSSFINIDKCRLIAKSFPNLEKLELMGSRPAFSIQDFEKLKNLPLKELDLSYNKLSGADIEKINNLESLEKLSLENCNLNAGDFIPLKHNKNLKSLRAAKNTDFGLNDLEALLELEALQYLIISSKSLSAEIVKNAVSKRKNIFIFLNGRYRAAVYQEKLIITFSAKNLRRKTCVLNTIETNSIKKSKDLLAVNAEQDFKDSSEYLYDYIVDSISEEVILITPYEFFEIVKELSSWKSADCDGICNFF